jgi:predicted nuclease of restriction endonuclease-like (RecB) superfamily
MKEEKYIQLLAQVKEQIQLAQIKTVSAANSQMLFLYWKLGNTILQNQAQQGWGAKIIELLSADIKKELPNLKGFSIRNLKYMKAFAESYPINVIQQYNFIETKLKTESISQNLVSQLLLSEENLIVQQPVAQLEDNNFNPTITQRTTEQSEEALFLSSILAKISWSHHVILIDKLRHLGKRLWYMLNSLEHGNSRNILAMQIESGLFERQVSTQKINNFTKNLPPVQSDFANYLLKDPYIFDFVQAQEKANERNIEEQLSQHISKFLLELGQGFAFVGRQVHIEVGNTDFYMDLLFYHTKLHCYVVVELKARPFEPGDASQLNFYVNVVNDKMRTPHDNDTIGLLLCRGKNEVLAEYALRGFNAAIGISDYQLSKAIPEELKPSLPQIEDLENELTEIKN